LNRLVVDASIAVKWYLPEAHADHAARLCRGDTALEAPDLLYAEVGNALWKRVRRKELRREQADEILSALGQAPLEIFPCRLLAPAALEIAGGTGLTVYDCLYLATAMLTGSRLVTADRRLFERARDAPLLMDRVLWIEELPKGD
jgi:predicted nucleic acid-binding protein